MCMSPTPHKRIWRPWIISITAATPAHLISASVKDLASRRCWQRQKPSAALTLPRKTRRDGWATRRLRFVIRPRRNACWVFPRVIFRLSPCWNLPGLGKCGKQFCQLMTSPGARPQTIFVAIPVYNGAPYIGQAIQSLISQSYPHWRLTFMTTLPPTPLVKWFNHSVTTG